jgi:acyl dehydratase
MLNCICDISRDNEFMLRDLTIADLERKVGKEIYVSDWTSVSQHEINEFGRVTRDPDPIHIDPEFARTNGPFGTTVLFGFQILSLLSFLSHPLRFQHGDGRVGYDLNYGLNRVRFVTPIPVNVRFRNHVTLKKIEQRKSGDYLITTLNTVELEGAARPALVAEWLGLLSRDAGKAPARSALEVSPAPAAQRARKRAPDT